VPGRYHRPCATDYNEIVVNGWSPSKRNNPFANSGTVVQINLEDVPGKPDDPFRMLNFQHDIEKAAYAAGGGKLVARPTHGRFLRGRTSANLPVNSYLPGTKSMS